MTTSTACTTARCCLPPSRSFLVTLRMALMFRENLHMLERSQEEALTDSLTGLRNRRSLMDDLEHELTLATPEEPRALVLLDLDGFKQYNDSFGHLAGDGLLARLGERLAYMIGDDGRAYRLGGDEFCALVTLGPRAWRRWWPSAPPLSATRARASRSARRTVR